ncbi:hypothetical protein [uncultured Paludibaculum sp.]|uniref:hypothetical protein n=1 Tax=uncultured Paludibaculum sp. TaxID=1765020 RepID=UPI002AAADC2C|nr:hypothetical protein [uncultured Paludibaculum sp.]
MTGHFCPRSLHIGGLPAIAAVTLSLTAGVLAPVFAQQAPVQRTVLLTVTDPAHRFVTGLDQSVFEVAEGGAKREITRFSAAGEPTAIAVVSDTPLADLSAQAPNELTQARTVPEAVRQLMASSTPRKALIVTTSGGASGSVPGGIYALRVDAADASKAVVEVANQYMLIFASPDGTGADGALEVRVKQPGNPAPMKVNLWR